MERLPPALGTAFAAKLHEQDVPESQRAEYREWPRFYLDLCRKHRHWTRDPESLPRFLEKLAAKGQSEVHQQDATEVVLALADAAASSRNLPD